MLLFICLHNNKLCSHRISICFGFMHVSSDLLCLFACHVLHELLRKLIWECWCLFWVSAAFTRSSHRRYFRSRSVFSLAWLPIRFVRTMCCCGKRNQWVWSIVGIFGYTLVPSIDQCVLSWNIWCTSTVHSSLCIDPLYSTTEKPSIETVRVRSFCIRNTEVTKNRMLAACLH